MNTQKGLNCIFEKWFFFQSQTSKAAYCRKFILRSFSQNSLETMKWVIFFLKKCNFVYSHCIFGLVGDIFIPRILKACLRFHRFSITSLMVSNEIQAKARREEKISTKAEFYNTKYHVKCGKVSMLYLYGWSHLDKKG